MPRQQDAADMDAILVNQGAVSAPEERIDLSLFGQRGALPVRKPALPKTICPARFLLKVDQRRSVRRKKRVESNRAGSQEPVRSPRLKIVIEKIGMRGRDIDQPFPI